MCALLMLFFLQKTTNTNKVSSKFSSLGFIDITRFEKASAGIFEIIPCEVRTVGCIFA